MNKMKPHSASKKSCKVRKQIISIIDKPMRFVDIEQKLHAMQKVSERTKKAHISNHLTKLVEVGCLTISDTRAKAQDRYWYTWTGVEYEPRLLSGENAGVNSEKHYEPLRGNDPDSIQKKIEEERAKNSFAYGSAMRNVANLAEKLRQQSRMMRRDNERQLNRTPIGCGISQVYEG